MRKESLDFFRKIVSFDTNSLDKTHYEGCVREICKELKARGIRHGVIDGRDERGRIVPNIVAHAGKGKKKLVLAVHYDVVPAEEGWKRDPFKLVVKNGKAYGRGANDDKGSIVACIDALEELGRNTTWEIILLITGDEEIGGESGLGRVVKKIKKAELALIVDAAPEGQIGASGIIHARIKVFGKQCHAATEYGGENAIEKVLVLIGELKKFRKKKEKRTSFLFANSDAPKKKVWRRLNITMFNGGTKENIIPGEAEIGIDMRMLPEDDLEKERGEFIDFVKRASKKKKIKLKIEIKHAQAGYYSDPRNAHVKRMLSIISRHTKDNKIRAALGGNDGPYFMKRNMPVVCFGAIRTEGNPHGKDEFVYLKDLELVRKVIVDFVNEGK